MPSKRESISIEVCADEESVRLARSQAVRRRRSARALEDRSGDNQLVYEQVVEDSDHQPFLCFRLNSWTK